MTIERAVIVLGDPTTKVGSFVSKSLMAAKIVAYFVRNTEEYEALSRSIEAKWLILIDSDWTLLLVYEQPRPRTLVVKWSGDSWDLPWESVEFVIHDPYNDERRFWRLVNACLEGKVE